MVKIMDIVMRTCASLFNVCHTYLLATGKASTRTLLGVNCRDVSYVGDITLIEVQGIQSSHVSHGMPAPYLGRMTRAQVSRALPFVGLSFGLSLTG